MRAFHIQHAFAFARINAYKVAGRSRVVVSPEPPLVIQTRAVFRQTGHLRQHRTRLHVIEETLKYGIRRVDFSDRILPAQRIVVRYPVQQNPILFRQILELISLDAAVSSPARANPTGASPSTENTRMLLRLMA